MTPLPNRQSVARIIMRLVPACVFIFAWQAIIWMRPNLAFFIGSPLLYIESLKAQLIAGTNLFGNNIPSGKLFIDTAVTAVEALGGFLIGNLIGVAAGLWLSRKDIIASTLKPYIVFLGSAPLFAFAPIIVLWFGIGLWSKIIVAALSTVFIAQMQAFKGAMEVNRDLVQVAQAFGATNRQIFWKIVVPSSAVWVINAFRLNVGFALLGAFLGEFINSTNGLGHLILVAGGLYNIPLVLVGVSAISVLGLGLTMLVDALETPAKKLLSKAF